jgi:tRNA(Ile)-lysidine synthase TilS/MesJ
MDRTRCVKCGKKAAVSLAYGPHAFCKQHFLEFFENRVKKTCREHRLVQGREKIVVAYSGGKDSGTALFLMKKLFGERNKVEALLVDEGIQGYRENALAVAERNCRKWGIPFKRVFFREEFGLSMKQAAEKKGKESACAFCGTLRRRVLNRHAKEMNAGVLATGHNLDDESQSILMNVFDADTARFFRLGPKSREQQGMVKRVKPLYFCPEKEVELFAGLSGIEFFKKGGCPFKSEAKRNWFRKTLDGAEAVFPGTKFSIARFLAEARQGRAVEGKKRSACI